MEDFGKSWKIMEDLEDFFSWNVFVLQQPFHHFFCQRSQLRWIIFDFWRNSTAFSKENNGDLQVQRKGGVVKQSLAWNSGEQRVSYSTEWSVWLHIRLAIVSRQIVFHLTSLPLCTSRHDYLEGERASCLMNTHWNTVWSNRQSQDLSSTACRSCQHTVAFSVPFQIPRFQVWGSSPSQGNFFWCDSNDNSY